MTQPSSETLAQALEQEGAPDWMIEKARLDYYHDFKSPLIAPEHELYNDALANNLNKIAEGVLVGKWDATKEESDAWAASPEGQATFNEVFRGRQP